MQRFVSIFRREGRKRSKSRTQRASDEETASQREVQGKLLQYCRENDLQGLTQLVSLFPEIDINSTLTDSDSTREPQTTGQSSQSVNSTSSVESFPLYIACEKNHVDLVAFLLSHPQINPNKKKRAGGFTPLYIAAEKGHTEVVRLLLAWASPDAAAAHVDVNLETDKGATPLYIACEKGHLELIGLLLEHPEIEVNKSFKTSFSPFFVACECGHAAVVERLLREERVDVNRSQHQGATPFFMACQKGRLEAVRVLLRCEKVDVNRPRDTGATPLYIACEFNHPEIVRELLNCERVDPNKQRKGGYTPLFRLCEKGHMDALRIMLQSARVDINLGSNKGTTPLYIACERNQIEVVKELLALPHLDVSKPHDQNFTPFFVACRFGHTEIVQMLMEDQRTDVNKPQHQGASPFYIACHFGRVNTVKVLLKNESVDVKFPMRNGGTPFWTAASNGQEAVVKWMLVSGRDVGINFRWSGNNKTAAQQARHKGYTKIATLIEEFEANSDQVISELEMELGIWDKFKSKKEVELLQGLLDKERDVTRRLMVENKMLKRENERLRLSAKYSFAEPGEEEKEQKEEQPEVSVTVTLFSSSDLADVTNDFNPECKIAEGGQAEVYKAVLMSNEVAIKRFSVTSPQVLHSILSELDILKKYQHPHLMQLVGHSNLKDERPCLVYPFMVNGNLRERLNSREGNEVLSWEKRLKIALQAAKGLAFLHNPTEEGSSAGPLIHLDVKSENMLLDENFDVRISDFGLSRRTENQDIMKTRAAFGTIGYLCPDFLSNGIISTKTDVFAFGVVLAELLTGKHAIFHQNNGKPMNLSRFFLETLPQTSSLLPSNIIDPEIRKGGAQASFRIFAQIARHCLDPDPERRLPMELVVKRLDELIEGNSRLCVVCMDNPTNGRMNCGHAVLCYPCAEYLLLREERCPLCRVKVTAVEQGSYDKSFVAA